MAPRCRQVVAGDRARPFSWLGGVLGVTLRQRGDCRRTESDDGVSYFSDITLEGAAEAPSTLRIRKLVESERKVVKADSDVAKRL